MIIKISRWCWHIVLAIANWCRSVFTKITKIEIKDEVWDGLMQFVKFGMVGLTNTFISYAAYYILVPLGCNIYLASIIGFFLSIINAYYWNNNYVFKKQEQEYRSPIAAFMKLFLSYAGTGLILHNVLLWVWTDLLNISSYIAPILNIVITVPLNFLLNKFWAFRKNKKLQKQEGADTDSAFDKTDTEE